VHRQEKCESSDGNFTACAVRVPYRQPAEVKEEVKKEKNAVLVIAKLFLYPLVKR
jgi:hypothetical protein